MSVNHITIQGVKIGEGYPPYVVAELSGNHNGSIERAKKLILEAYACGADAVKIQTFKPESITLPSYRDEFLLKDGLWKGRILYELYQETCLPYEWHEELVAYAKAVGITLFSSPFSEEDVEFLETFDVPAYKIASNELTHLPLIDAVIKTGKPIILSTGTATLDEIQKTAAFLEKRQCRDYIFLHCVSSYPAPLSQSHLSNIQGIKDQIGGLVGLSDHSMGIIAPIVATALGACFIEKHFTLNRDEGGSDSAFSLEPYELKQLCEGVRLAFQSIGTSMFGHKNCEAASPIFKRHYYAISNIKKGEILSLTNIAAVRSPKGIPSHNFEKVIGKTAAREIKKHEPISIEDIVGYA